ncbi:MAG: phosphoadenosine phosphosulfate reductase family protein [bacterium]
MENKHTKEYLKELQALPLERKIQLTAARIIEWHNYFEGKVYVSFSGGKDSTVLLDMARKLFPDIEAVFVDTGLEYPEIRKFVKGFENVTWLKPKMRFDEVVEHYGYPVIGKDVSRCVHEWVRNPTGTNASKILGTFKNKDGGKSIYCCDKYKYLLDAPFKISHNCCDVMKKRVVHLYEKECKKKAIVGTMTDESMMRKTVWLKSGCNSFNGKLQVSKPISFWTEQDILIVRYMVTWFIKMKMVLNMKLA